MQRLSLHSLLVPGPEKQVTPLFRGPGRRLVQITLRRGARLAAHTSPVPITIHCLEGTGTLSLTADGSVVALSPGVLVTLEAGEMHEVDGAPDVSILLSQFTAAS